jgi:hypothetical protein
MAKDNAAQEIADDMLTDPDKDAERDPAPVPPQTVDAEPNGERDGRR